MSFTAADWRAEILDITRQYRNTPGDAPPPQLVEAMVNLETGGTFDPALVDPSGATGLGQVMTNGAEYAAFMADPVMRAKYPGGPNLLDGYQNLEVMVYGLNMRQELGGALSDWFMAAASYLGGADTSGFNGNADSYGTDGRAYALNVRDYIVNTWGMEAADVIDYAQPGAVMGLTNDTAYFDAGRQSFSNTQPKPSTDARVPATYDDLFNEKVYDNDGSVLGNLIDGAGDVLDFVKDPAGAVTGVLDGIVSAVGRALPRVGLFLAGLVILGLGLWAIKGGAG